MTSTKTTMDCAEARTLVLAQLRGKLDATQCTPLTEHIESCAECRALRERERVLDEALTKKLPQFSLSPEARRRLTERWRGLSAPGATVLASVPPAPSQVRRGRRWPLASAIAAAALAAMVLPPLIIRHQHTRAGAEAMAMLTREAVNDHLRVLYSARGVEVENNNIHNVKPWFAGRVDFAPVVSFSGDADFPLVGGSVGYYLDRKAAVFVFKRKLHTVSLLTFDPQGMAWPNGEGRALGPLRVWSQRERGFNVLLWQANGIGYALISDADASSLDLLAQRVAP